MNEDDTARAAAPAASEPSHPIKELLARLATDGSEVIEAWVRAAVLDKDVLAGDRSARYELADPLQGRRGGALYAMLTSKGLARLEQQFGTILPWGDLVGAELDVKIRTTRHAGKPATNEILDVEAAWVDRSAEVGRRLHLRSLAAIGRYDCRRFLPEPTVVRTIGIVHPQDDPLWPTLARDLAGMEKLDVRCGDTSVEMRGHLGRMRVTRHLERWARGDLPTPDILLILSSEGDHLFFREQPDTASLAAQMPCPVIVGFIRGRHGSLLHDVAFSANEDPLAAIGSARMMVLNARASKRVERRIAAHAAWKDARRRRPL